MKMIPEQSGLKHAGALLALGFALLALLAGAALGRYEQQFRAQGFARAKDFYFSSDFLDGKEHTLAPGSTELSFTLGNHGDELRYSEVDIEYEVTVTPSEGVTVSGGSGTLPKDTKSDADITILGLEPGSYTITAIGSGGYEKTLTATVKVLAEAGQLYQHLETSPDYSLLTLWNEGNEPGEVTISYAGIPDNTNPNMKDWTTNDSESITIEAHESKVFRFFGAKSIIVTQNGANVESKNPAS